MVGAMFPLRIRAAAMSVATAFNWIANWAVTSAFPRMSDWNRSATYAIYAAYALLSFGFIAGFVPRDQRQGTGGHGLSTGNSGAGPHVRLVG